MDLPTMRIVKTGAVVPAHRFKATEVCYSCIDLPNAARERLLRSTLDDLGPGSTPANLTPFILGLHRVGWFRTIKIDGSKITFVYRAKKRAQKDI
jgi:hypothetical protein